MPLGSTLSIISNHLHPFFRDLSQESWDLKPARDSATCAIFDVSWTFHVDRVEDAVVFRPSETKIQEIRMLGKIQIFVASAIGFTLVAGRVPAATTDFYDGKTIRIVVGASAGGGVDTYARTIARHMGKHIPGKPAIIVENMAGAGSLIAANHLYKVAKPDGLTVGSFLGGLILQKLLGRQGIEFDPLKFEYVGIPAKENYVIGVSKATGINSVEKWMATKTPVKLGGVGSGSGTDDIPKVLTAVVGLPLQLVTGYKGTAEVRLAFNSGEVSGVCIGWGTFASTWRKELDSGELNVVLQAMAKPHPALPKIPLAIDLAKTDEARKLIQAVAHTNSDILRLYVLPPGTPKDRVRILGKAFIDTLHDKEFLAEAQKARLEIEPVPGEAVETIVSNLFKLEPALVARLKEILQ
jgi:tripartite-type tricarboxylate transporter receptor subunit TctC